MAASSAIASSSTTFINKKDVGLSAFSSQASFSVQTARKRISKRIVSVMTPQQTERKPATTGSVKTGMTMTEKILAKASDKPDVSPGDNVWVNVDVLMTHDVCGPGSIGIFKKEFGQNAKVWDREKLVIIPDHYIFTTDERANRNVDILRDFCNEQNIKLILITRVSATLLLHKKVTADLERFCWVQTPTHVLLELSGNSPLELAILMQVLCWVLARFCSRCLQL